MLQVNTSIAASSIEGVGVFAAEPIAKGTLIWRFYENFEAVLNGSHGRAGTTLSLIARAVSAAISGPAWRRPA